MIVQKESEKGVGPKCENISPATGSLFNNANAFYPLVFPLTFSYNQQVEGKS